MTKEEVTMHPGPEPPDGAKQAQPKQLQEKQKALERESVDVSAEIQFKESQKHAGEPGRQLYHQPTLHVAWYPDDGCVLVKRFGDNNINPARWILDPARIPTQPLPTPAGPIKGAARQPEQYPRPLIRVNMQTG